MDVRIILLICSLSYTVGLLLNRTVGIQDVSSARNEVEEEIADDESREEDERKDVFQSIIDVNLEAGVAKTKIDVDMAFSIEQKVDVQGDLIKYTSMHWDDSYTDDGTTYIRVPFVYDSTANDNIQSAFQEAIDEYTEKTCIRLVPRTDETSYINVINGQGCYSYVGKQTWPQDLSLQDYGCAFKDIAIHEIMHALGYFHEQSRPDRADYIKIVKRNMMSGVISNFQIEDDTLSQGTPYDYKSVMHYGPYAFSKNGKPTIIRLHGDPEDLGNNYGLSEIDTWSLNNIYCGNNGPLPTQEPTPEPTTMTTTTAGPSTGITWPNDRNFCKLVRIGGFCRYCDFNKHCADECKDRSKKCARWARGGSCTGRRISSMSKSCGTSCRDAFCELFQ